LVLDTNIALYHLGNLLVQPLPSGGYFISVITEMELLSYPGLTEVEAKRIKGFLSELLTLPFSM
jgi:predicted nucleic acid-binding protein